VFAPPGATFSAGGTCFRDYRAVHDAFVSGALSEADLKAGLTEAVNALVQPVREHFATNERAATILATITGWMAEPKELRASPLRRLQALPDGHGPAWAVFAPPPSLSPTAGAALDLLRCLRAAPDGWTRVLWLSDWSALSLNCVSGGKTTADDLKAICAAQDLLVGCLRALDPQLMAGVVVRRQSEAILSDPSNYWISVINAGRAHSLGAIRAADENSEQVGFVIATLMAVADALALGAAAGTGRVLCCSSPRDARSLELAVAYLEGCAAYKAAGLSPPEVRVVEGVSLALKADAAAADADAELLLLDGQPDVQRKMKKAFCEPGNTAFCPPLAVARELVLGCGASLEVKRREEDGGDRAFGKADGGQLASEFAAGALHPGDLKPAVRDAAWGTLSRVRAAVAADKALAAAEKEVAKAAKKNKKK